MHRYTNPLPSWLSSSSRPEHLWGNSFYKITKQPNHPIALASACGLDKSTEPLRKIEGRKYSTVQRFATKGTGTGEAPQIVREVLNSPGQRLDSATRAYFEPRFGHDFSQVRVHTDARAAHSARAVNALAYTVGQDIVFGDGQYAPGISTGITLLAHELVHVMQQRSMTAARSAVLGEADDEHEREAEAVSLTLLGVRSRYQSHPSNLGTAYTQLELIANPTQLCDKAGMLDFDAGWQESSFLGESCLTLRRVSFGGDGSLSAERQAIVRRAAEIAERLVTGDGGIPDFRRKWEAFWQGTGRSIAPKPSLEHYRAAVLGRVVHDMDGSTRPSVREFLSSETGLPLERQTAAVTEVNSMDTYIRRFAIDQGVDSVVSLLLHESMHGAGVSMGPALIYEPFLHGFEAEVGFPLMMGGADILSVVQARHGDTEVDVTFTYNLRRIGEEPPPEHLEIQVVDMYFGQVVFDELPNGRRTPARGTLSRRIGRGNWIWHARNPGWVGYAVRIYDPTSLTILASRQFETNPRCVVGVSTMHCENE